MRVILSLVIIVLTFGFLWGQNTKRRNIKPVRTVPNTETTVPVSVSDTVTHQPLINDKVEVSEFKKVLASRVESVILTNKSVTDTVQGLILDINYLDLKGKQINRRQVSIDVMVPPGESRFASFASWDKQQLFYHIGTPPAKKTQRATPFKVKITPKKLVLTKRVAP